MNRKDEHIYFALKQNKNKNSFDEYRIKYYSIPSISIEEISLKTSISDIEFDFPFFINAITAGSEKADEINKKLEYVAKKTNIFLFPGSYSPFLQKDDNDYPKEFGLNLGIDKKIDNYLKAINIVKPKLLQVHINPIQELLMPEGDKNFSLWEKNLKDIIREVKIPIILKETGFGMSKETIEKAIELGVKIIDISGKGGTDFSMIENSRSKNPKTYYEEIGYNTVESIKNANEYRDKIEIIASGGIRNPLDIVKALALGAKFVGVSKIFLEILENKGTEELINTIEEWKLDLKYLFLLTNSKNIDELYMKIFKIGDDK